MSTHSQSGDRRSAPGFLGAWERLVGPRGVPTLAARRGRKPRVPLTQVLPALKRPTVSHLSDGEWLAVNTILDESTVRTIIPRLKQAGGEGIVEYPLNKIVL